MAGRPWRVWSYCGSCACTALGDITRRRTTKHLFCRKIDDDEVLKRCLYALVNEGPRILQEGIALRPCDIDIVYINGYGFPEVTGGPMFWADQQGLDKVLADIRKYHDIYGGTTWEPAPLLEKLVKEGKGFASLQG